MMLGEIVKTLRAAQGWGTPEVARRASEHGSKVSYQKIQQLEAKPDTWPGYLPQLAAAFEKTIDELLTWEPGLPTLGPHDGRSSYSPQVARHETPEGYLRFQVMGEGGAGPGVLNSEHPEVLREVEIAEWQLRKELGRIPSPDRVKLLTVRGNSMAPRIKSGDVVFVDMTDRDPFDGGLFVVILHGHALVKRIEIRTDGLHIVSLASPDRPDILPPERMGEVQIAGRVLGAIQLRRSDDL